MKAKNFDNNEQKKIEFQNKDAFLSFFSKIFHCYQNFLVIPLSKIGSFLVYAVVGKFLNLTNNEM